MLSLVVIKAAKARAAASAMRTEAGLKTGLNVDGLVHRYLQIRDEYT
jgi:hypothetical protein